MSLIDFLYGGKKASDVPFERLQKKWRESVEDAKKKRKKNTLQKKKIVKRRDVIYVDFRRR